MEISKEVRVSMSWNVAGQFSAELINGNISALHFCEEGRNICLESVDLKYLHAVHDALGDLFGMIDAQQLEMGHSFARQEAGNDGTPGKTG